MHYNRLRSKGDLGPAGTIRKYGFNRMVDNKGYIRVADPTGRKRSEAEHRVVMQEHLGRQLFPFETVHHINGDRSDNRLSNLELWSSSQPSGQRVEDKLAWAREILALYEGT